MPADKIRPARSAMRKADATGNEVLISSGGTGDDLEEFVKDEPWSLYISRITFST